METVYREQTADRQLEKNKKLMTIGLAALCTAFVAILGKAWLDGSFDSVETFQKYVAGFGLAAPLFLIAVQAAQVVLPVLPGLLGCVAGSMMFGCWGGFWCNYIGISAGSIIAFLLARKYGSGLVSRMFPGEKYEKWAAWAAGSRRLFLLFYRHHEDEYAKIRYNHSAWKALVYFGVLHHDHGGSGLTAGPGDGVLRPLFAPPRTAAGILPGGCS